MKLARLEGFTNGWSEEKRNDVAFAVHVITATLESVVALILIELPTASLVAFGFQLPLAVLTLIFIISLTGAAVAYQIKNPYNPHEGTFDEYRDEFWARALRCVALEFAILALVIAFARLLR